MTSMINKTKIRKAEKAKIKKKQKTLKQQKTISAADRSTQIEATKESFGELFKEIIISFDFRMETVKKGLQILIDFFQGRMTKFEETDMRKLRQSFQKHGYVINRSNIAPVLITNGIWKLLINGNHRFLILTTDYGLSETWFNVVKIDFKGSVKHFISKYESDLYLLSAVLNPLPKYPSSPHGRSWEWTIWNMWKKQLSAKDSKKLEAGKYTFKEMQSEITELIYTRVVPTRPVSYSPNSKEMKYWVQKHVKGAMGFKRNRVEHEILFYIDKDLNQIAEQLNLDSKEFAKKNMQFVNSIAKSLESRSYRGRMEKEEAVILAVYAPLLEGMASKDELQKEREKLHEAILKGLRTYIAGVLNGIKKISYYKKLNSADRLEFRKQLVENSMKLKDYKYFKSQTEEEEKQYGELVPMSKIISTKKQKAKLLQIFGNEYATKCNYFHEDFEDFAEVVKKTLSSNDS